MQARVRVKICGITSPEDALAASAAGADAIGLNFVGGPRRLDERTAEAILAALPPGCTPVALVEVGTGQRRTIRALLDRHNVSHVQLYGPVDGEALGSWMDDGFKPILVHRLRPQHFPADVNERLSGFGSRRPAAILLDAFHEKLQGGTGRTLDWKAIAAARAAGALSDWPPLVLAGGLTPDNVAKAITLVRPWAVDVSSGVESSPGCKDPAKMAAFVAHAHRAGGR